MRRALRWIVKGLAILTITGITAIAMLLAGLWLEHRGTVTLPTPTGPFAIGRSIQSWRDTGSRELLVWIWYPATGSPGETIGDYLPPPVAEAMRRERGTLISNFLTHDLSRARAHSAVDAPASKTPRSFPVLIMRAGASAEVANYSALAEDLAGHGYIVVGFDAPFRTNLVVFPDGRVIKRTPANNPERCLAVAEPERSRCAEGLLSAWTSDMAFVLDRLTQMNANVGDTSGRFAGRLDLTRVGVFGHSFGGAATLKFCQEDRRCQAAVDIDGAPHGRVIETGLRQPLMVLLSDHSQESDPESQRIKADMQSIYNHLGPSRRVYIAIRGANHFTFSDDGALLKSGVVRGVLRRFGLLRLDGDRQLAITRYCLRSFFDAYLKGSGDAPPTLASATYPEIEPID